MNVFFIFLPSVDGMNNANGLFLLTKCLNEGWKVRNGGMGEMGHALCACLFCVQAGRKNIYVLPSIEDILYSGTREDSIQL